jgi:hypothetical protein
LGMIPNVDVMLEPPSLWRMGQLTWATFGAWVRLASFLCKELRLAIEVLRACEEVRPTVRQAAMRDRRDSEPLSPPYGEFEFPAWM